MQNVKDRIPPGTAALLLLIEHQWARELKGAIRNAGGVPIVQGFLTPEALLMVGAELRAVAEAKDTIALAEAAEGAAVLSALATVEAAEQIQQAAVTETARVLIAAGLIEAAATQDVIDTLIAADLIKQEALDEAKAAVGQSNADSAGAKAGHTGNDGKSSESANAPSGAG